MALAFSEIDMSEATVLGLKQPEQQSDLVRQKVLLRQKSRQALLESQDQLKTKDTDIMHHLLKLFYPEKGLCASFAAMTGEPDLIPLINLMPGWSFAYPKVDGQDLKFFKVTEPDKQMIRGSWGVWEPKEDLCQPVALDDCDLVLVPGLAFDRRGYRLGRGKGFYDRALESYSGHAVGVCYLLQLCGVDLPREEHDRAMDWVVTENFVLKLN